MSYPGMMDVRFLFNMDCRSLPVQPEPGSFCSPHGFAFRNGDLFVCSVALLPDSLHLLQLVMPATCGE